MRVMVTGSGGLIGSEAAEFYLSEGHEVLGIDNNLRRYFFGVGGDTTSRQGDLQEKYRNYAHRAVDIRDREAVRNTWVEFQPEFIVHAAAQPSHDWAAREPFTDFDVNANGTLNILEAMRQITPDATLAFLSTNKVYGDNPNRLELEEQEKRYELPKPLRGVGIAENHSIDGCLHSLFGCSKLAADVMTQEYGSYFGMKTGVFRGGCLSGSRHAAVELHGFLAYLVRTAMTGGQYKIFGYKGKQVRDQIHSSDVIQALECFRRAPRPGAVYNLGGGFSNSASILELVDTLKGRYQLRFETQYVDQNRRGDHLCYYTDLRKLQSDYPEFHLKMTLDDILEEIVRSVDEELRRVA